MDRSPCMQETRGPLDGITGVILAGGASSRMGRNKALLMVDGMPLIEKIHRTMIQLFRDVVLVTNTPEVYAFLPCRTVTDIYPGFGSIAGLHAGLAASSEEWIFVAACDAPFINPDVIRMLSAVSAGYDAVVPISEGGKEPLHALYGRRCLAEIEQVIRQGDRRLLILLDRVRTRYVTPEERASIPGAELSFCNVNTPDEYAAMVGKRKP
ncbi:molybdenum cofactor guanylyltransferase [Oryzomonas sagensis]|uniref:Probable molybdenum cofactor guanylyltransferase n=1 Tax=Oryzomonas sagensis TaxID=2603857 RepID=A0ABQ6TQD9_9BACT|nr:molybdenum cofactor guanylyltransferase [Oryzomonas sagensis]KAB0671254.1 molybdenum cofactor guanylyltransferase [Oryzomonas sagensis]